jgi:hypothetical protein
VRSPGRPTSMWRRPVSSLQLLQAHLDGSLITLKGFQFQEESTLPNGTPFTVRRVIYDEKSHAD